MTQEMNESSLILVGFFGACAGFPEFFCADADLVFDLGACLFGERKDHVEDER